MPYVDGYVLPLRKKNIAAYRRIARIAGKVWRDHGALDYRECIGEDLDVKFMLPFPRAMRIKRGETVVFGWIVFKSRAQRDRVNAKVMRDPRMAGFMKKAGVPFDEKRVMYGGFDVLVAA